MGRWNRWRSKNPGPFDLTHARLARAELSGANLANVDLHASDLTGASLIGANLEGADLHRSSLKGADLSRAVLRGADLHAANLSRASLFGADLSKASVRKTSFRNAEADGYQARFETVVRLYDRKGKTLVAEYADVDTARVPTYEATLTFEPLLKEKRLAVEPGRYLIDVVLTDAESRKEARRRQRVEIVAVGAPQPVLSRIRLEAKQRGASFAPILSLHLPAGLDSLRTAVELYNAQHLGEAHVAMVLMHVPSDTSAARPPYTYNVGQGFGLVRYNRADTLQVTRRPLRNLDQEVVIEFGLPVLPEGIYRVDVRVTRTPSGVSGEDLILERRRDFAVRNATYPQITALDEMVEALVYIARKHELEHIRAAETPEEKKRRFDAFWGSLVPEQTRAANLLKLYYSRVEEANLLYTTYKEGWKTDRGMVYVLFGSPLYVDTQLEYELWRYSYDEYDTISAFVFTRRRLYASGGLFEAYLLERDYSYEAGWRRALRRWRRGEVL